MERGLLSRPHPEEARSAVSKDEGAAWFETHRFPMLLTMRPNEPSVLATSCPALSRASRFDAITASKDVDGWENPGHDVGLRRCRATLAVNRLNAHSPCLKCSRLGYEKKLTSQTFRADTNKKLLHFVLASLSDF